VLRAARSAPSAFIAELKRSAKNMTTEELKSVIDSAIGGKVIISYAQLIIILLLAVAAYVVAYLKKKGENRALQEDVRRLTQSVEDIKLVYVKQVEDYKVELARRSQATKIADLLSRFHYTDTKKCRQEFVQLAWELSIWLPPEVVRKLTEHLVEWSQVGPSSKSDPKNLLITVRKLLHGSSDDLLASQIMHMTDPTAHEKK
jgi:hypothetical protein